MASSSSSSSATPATPPACRVHVYLLHSASSACADRAAAMEALRGRLQQASASASASASAPAVVASVTLVTQHEPVELLQDVAKLVDLEASRVPVEALRTHIRNIQIQQLSNAMKHLHALRLAAATLPQGSTDSSDLALVLEDDCLPPTQLSSALSTAVVAAKQAGADITFLGLPAPPDAVPDGIDDVHSVFAVLPACDSYLVTPAAAARLAAAFLPVRFPTHLQLTMLMRTLSLRSRIAVPNVFVDGSKLGVFACTLDPNNRLLWNQEFCKMNMLVRGAPPTPTDVAARSSLLSSSLPPPSPAYGAEQDAEFERLWEAQQFKDHPDVLALRASHLARLGRYAEAEAAYATALAAYDKHKCIVTNASIFLREYIDVFQHLQPIIDMT